MANEVSAYAKRIAGTLTPDLVSVLRKTPTFTDQDHRTKSVVLKGDGVGQLRYQLRRKGLIRLSHPDGKGRATAYRTAFGNEVLQVLGDA